jgi:hypothetical protein
MAWTGIPLPVPLLHTDQFTLKIATSHAKYERQIAVLYLNAVKHLSSMAGEKDVQIYVFCCLNGDLDYFTVGYDEE